MIRFFALAFVLLSPGLKSELDSLVEAERSFAGLSLLRGTRDAFLANLNDESILFRPRAVPGKSWMEKNPPATSRLMWEPAFADIASSADIGYTTGPWELSRTPEEPPSAFGHYVTVWKRQPDGVWKVAVDIGISHSRSPKPAAVEFSRIKSNIEQSAAEKQIQSARTSLLEAERKFPADAETHMRRLAEDARLYRNDNFPVIGANAIRTVLSKSKDRARWNVMDANVAKSGDFGYAYGTVESRPGEVSNYLRIWKRQRNGDWKVVLDLVS